MTSIFTFSASDTPVLAGTWSSGCAWNSSANRFVIDSTTGGSLTVNFAPVNLGAIVVPQSTVYIYLRCSVIAMPQGAGIKWSLLDQDGGMITVERGCPGILYTPARAHAGTIPATSEPAGSINWAKVNGLKVEVEKPFGIFTSPVQLALEAVVRHT